MENIKTKEFENEYSRQIGAYGVETMGKLVKLEALIIGLKGLGIETAKNLVLAGPKKVCIYDPTIVTITDLGSNFFLSEEDVINKKRRDVACLDKLKELNPRCEVDILSVNLCESPELCAGYNVVAVTEIKNLDWLKKANLSVRNNNGVFIYAAAVGLSGFVFSDFGKEFYVRDNNGEECKQYLVKNISKDEKGIVMIDDANGGKLAYEDGDYVTFKEVKGMTSLNNGNPYQIKYISPFAFAIGNTSQLGNYISGGIVQQVKVPKLHSYRSFEEAFETPYLQGQIPPDPTDFAKFGRNELLHVAFQVLHKYYKDLNCLPCLNDMEAIKPYIEEARKIYLNGKDENVNNHWIKNGQDFNDEIVECVLKWSASSIVPITSFMGGIVAQEIIKYTGKFTPINQWLWFDYFECISNIPETADRTLKNSRYDEQIAILGNEIQNKLHKMNIFMIGAGALGCEFLKEFALMGISCNNKNTNNNQQEEGGIVTVTDNDHIEISNLNRQFLFRINDVKKPKSLVASNTVKKFNNNFNVKSLQALVSAETEDQFNEAFWTKQTFIINAVDNIKARKYIDEQCTLYGLPLIDSGTLGTKAHSQMIYPHVTSCYNDKQDPKVEDAVPMCTLHNFPSMIEHCIEYGRDAFNGTFFEGIQDLNKYLKDSNQFIKDMKKEGNTTIHIIRLTNLKELLYIANSKNFDKCIEMAFKDYTKRFDHNIKQLISLYPEDYKNKDGSAFWIGGKRFPKALPYSADDSQAFSYVACYATLIAQGLELNPLNFDYIYNYTKSIKIPPFVIQNINIKVSDNEEENNANSNQVEIDADAEEMKLNNLIQELSNINKSNINAQNIKAHEFEKDDDNNHHIDYIHSCANLRATNYSIENSDRLKTKLIAGKIVPAIATTTASITGLVALQIITGLNTNKIELMRDGFINLGMNIYLMTEPGPKIQMKDKEMDPILLSATKVIPPGWSVWDKIEINQSMTVKDLIEYYNTKYNVDVSIIAYKNISLYIQYTDNAKVKLNKKLEDLYREFVKKEPAQNFIILEVSCDTKEGDLALLPILKYRFR